MSDVDVSADSDGESSWDSAASLTDTDATLSHSSADISGLSDEDGDEELFLDIDEEETNSRGSIDVQVDVANMSDDDYDDSDSSSVQVLSEAEQLDVSSVVEVWTDRGDEQLVDDDEERTVSPDAAYSEQGNSDTEIEENNEPRAGTPALAVPSEQPQIAQPVPGHERSISDEEGTTCTICFETWTASGIHRLAALKCGHLYGLSCIERWVRGQRAKCPQCNAPARRGDIRPIFAQKLMALDTVQLDQVVSELNVEREKRKRSEIDAELMRQKYKVLLNDYEKVKSEYTSLKKMRLDITVSSHTDGIASGSSCSQRSSGVFTLDRAIDLGSGTSCRNLTVSGVLNQLVVSQSRTGLFNGYGLRKVSLFDLKSSEYVLVHKGEIKDIAFHHRDALVLSASHDKSVKLTAMISNSVVQTYHQPMEAWSCAWDKDDSNCFYVGLRNGSVFKYDMRITSEAVCKLPTTNRYEPVVAMQHIPKGPSCAEDRCPSGLLVSQFQMCSFFEKQSDTEFRVHPLHLEGNCVSISYEHNTRHLLMSCRPTARTPYMTHSICSLLFPMADEGNHCAFNIVHVFNGGPTQVQLSRSCICLDPEDAANFWAVAGDESYKQVLVWDASSGKRIHHLPVTNPVLDVCPVTTPVGWGLAALAKNTLSLYSWKQPSS